MYKLLIEEGDYIDVLSGESRGLMEAEISYTPDGINVGWDEFDSIEKAIEHYGIRRKEISESTSNDDNLR